MPAAHGYGRRRHGRLAAFGVTLPATMTEPLDEAIDLVAQLEQSLAELNGMVALFDIDAAEALVDQAWAERRRAQGRRAPDIGYVPTPMAVVQRMLELADVGPSDLLYDLGSGDGRIVVEAAQRHGARAVGIELNPRHVTAARARVQAAGLVQRVKIRRGDIFDVNLRRASVVTLYLLNSINRALLPALAGLRDGSRIVSHQFVLDGFVPDRSERMTCEHGMEHTLSLWITPLRPER